MQARAYFGSLVLSQMRDVAQSLEESEEEMAEVGVAWIGEPRPYFACWRREISSHRSVKKHTAVQVDDSSEGLNNTNKTQLPWRETGGKPGGNQEKKKTLHIRAERYS